MLTDPLDQRISACDVAYTTYQELQQRISADARCVAQAHATAGEKRPSGPPHQELPASLLQLCTERDNARQTYCAAVTNMLDTHRVAAVEFQARYGEWERVLSAIAALPASCCALAASDEPLSDIVAQALDALAAWQQCMRCVPAELVSATEQAASNMLQALQQALHPSHTARGVYTEQHAESLRAAVQREQAWQPPIHEFPLDALAKATGHASAAITSVRDKVKQVSARADHHCALQEALRSVESGWAANTHKFFQAQEQVEVLREEHGVLKARRIQPGSREKVAEALANLQSACRILDEQTTTLVRSFQQNLMFPIPGCCNRRNSILYSLAQVGKRREVSKRLDEFTPAALTECYLVFSNR